MSHKEQSLAQEKRGGRPAAGCDPEKRSQILDGAHRVFSQMGFDAASMNDITREAGVSKGTIYVYFPSKEELFEALIERERDVIFRDVGALLDGPEPIAERLERYATRMVTLLCSEEVINALRVMVGTAARMPELSARFYEGGGQRGVRTVTAALEAEVAAGRLAIDDPEIAACQFTELAAAGLFRRRLFAHMSTPPSEAIVARSVTGAVTVFMAAYGATGATR